MDNRNDSEEVDIVVGGVSAGPVDPGEISRFIAAYKQRPTYQADLEEARKILGDLWIRPNAHGMLGTVPKCWE